jgi:quinol monooxygenase YgiN
MPPHVAPAADTQGAGDHDYRSIQGEAESVESGRCESSIRASDRPKSEASRCLAFDIAQDLSDPTILIATEVFEREALEHQESLPEVKGVMELMPEILAADPEATIYQISSSEPWA